MDENIYYDNYMDDNSAENYDPFAEDPRYKKYYRNMKILKFILKTVVYVSVFGVIAALLFRIYTIQEPDMADRYLWNENGIAAYNQSEDFRVYSQKMTSYMWTDPETGESKEIKRDSFNGGDEIGDATMRITNMYYVKEAGQVQVTFRWNQNAEKALLEDFDLKELPGGEIFRFTLEDEKGNMYGDVSYITGQRYIYDYRRLLFDNVDFTNVKELYLNIYFSGKPSLEPYEQMIIYDYAIEPFEIAVDKPSGTTKGLIKTGK